MEYFWATDFMNYLNLITLYYIAYKHPSSNFDANYLRTFQSTCQIISPLVTLQIHCGLSHCILSAWCIKGTSNLLMLNSKISIPLSVPPFGI
jgi:hypothetical protein